MPINRVRLALLFMDLEGPLPFSADGPKIELPRTSIPF